MTLFLWGRPLRDLCPEADERDAMTDDEFWEFIYAQDWPYDDPDEDPPEVEITFVSPCLVCGEVGPCNFDADGRPMIHLLENEEVEGG